MLPHRSRSRFRWPITLSASLITANVVLMVIWIVLFARSKSVTALTLGAIAFALILVGLSFWLVLTIKEIRLNNRQANFVDSVTHELKSPIAAIQLWIETLRRQSMEEDERGEIYEIMASEIHRLDQLINQLLEAGRLDDIGQHQEIEAIELLPLIAGDAQSAAVRHGCDYERCLRFRGEPVEVSGRRLMLEIIFSNLIDNAFKYVRDEEESLVEVEMHAIGAATVQVTIASNSVPVLPDDRRRIFRIFERGGSELERRQKGTGLGLYIVSTLVKRMRGQVSVDDRSDRKPGTEFVVVLPGRRCDSPSLTVVDVGGASERPERESQAEALVPKPDGIGDEAIGNGLT